jgi:hypothetical protein
MNLVLLYMQHAHNLIYYQSSQNNIINKLDLGLYMLFPKLRFSSILSYSLQWRSQTIHIEGATKIFLAS